MGGDPPRTKTIFVRVHRTKISKRQMGEGSPPRGRTWKKCHAPKNFNPIFSKTCNSIFFNFCDQRGYLNLKFPHGIFRPRDPWRLLQRKQKNSLGGTWPPNLTPNPHDPRNWSRARRGAHDPEKILEIAQAVAEKIEFEKNSLGPPGGQTGSLCGHVTIWYESYEKVLYCVKILRP